MYASCRMLSKSKGQTLRVTATLHVLFHMETPLDVPDVISTATIEAAQNIMDVCIQHAAFLAGQGDVEDTIQEIIKHIHTTVLKMYALLAYSIS